jgi:hypothetical protein
MPGIKIKIICPEQANILLANKNKSDVHTWSTVHVISAEQFNLNFFHRKCEEFLSAARCISHSIA